MLEQLEELEISNVAIFVSDALRWDYLPKRVEEMGIVTKTVSASITTHTSFPSIITGVHPQKHGVTSWEGQIPELTDFLHLPTHDSSFFVGPEPDLLSQILRVSHSKRINELSKPWTYLERHLGTHAPYPTVTGSDISFKRFEEEYAGNIEALVEVYEQAAQISAERFIDRINEVKARDEEDDTLIIFTSDHGEYLGEDGLVSHESPVYPGGVYVPTVFIHPDLESGKADGIIRHVDIFPTVLSLLGIDIPSYIDGLDLAKQQPKYGYNLSIVGSILGGDKNLWKASSLWDEEGGIVINRTSILKKLATIVGLIVRQDGWQSRHIRRKPSHLPAFARSYFSSNITHGNPNFSVVEAKEVINKIEESQQLKPSNKQTLTDEQEDHLKDLGYL